jgi:serine/threonine protein kinase
MIQTDGIVKLSDFSLSNKFSDTINKNKSHVIGLPYWLAPEVIYEIVLFLKKLK